MPEREDQPERHFIVDVIRKEAWPFYRTISGVRLCWELEEPKGPKGPHQHTPSTCQETVESLSAKYLTESKDIGRIISLRGAGLITGS